MTNQIKKKQSQLFKYPQHLSQVNYLSIDALQSSIQDKIMLDVYHQAITDNAHLLIGKSVLHLTDGINLMYSLFLAKVGCEKVYCVLGGKAERENQNIYMMKQIVKQNNYEDVIEVMGWSSFNHQVDAIIAQPMGYCLHFDGLIDRIIQARDLHLIQRGLILPSIISYKCALIHDQHFHDHKVQYWNNVYGVPMTSMKQWIYHQPIIRVVDPSMVVSKATKLFTLDLRTITYEEATNLNISAKIDPLSACKANGAVFWFQALFDGLDIVKQIKASPWIDSTKFTQVTLYWKQVQQLSGKTINFKVKGKKYPREGYSIIELVFPHGQYQYSFS